MLKTLFWSRTLSIVVIPVMVEVTGNSPSFVVSQASGAFYSDDLPVCFIQAEDGQVQDLSKLCGQLSKNKTPTGTEFKQLQTSRQCSGCSLQGANLAGISLRGVNLKGAYLNEAKLTNTSLAFANLKGATLQNADLSGANLLGANLAGANLAGANLRGANLRGVSLDGVNLKGAIMPDGRTHN